MKLSNWKIGLALGFTASIAILGYSSCATIPKGAKAVRPFDKNKYLGIWYEIARIDFRFEKNLSEVTANYSLNPDGTIKVVNRGYNDLEKKWKESVGKAKQTGEDDEARLKVSFFGPFYAGYNVIAVDPDYQYALVAGKNTDYLWLLSRDKSIPAKVRTAYLKQAQNLGYDVSQLTWTKQSK